MLNRRLWILFFAFLLGFGVLLVRLVNLQVTRAQWSRTQLEKVVHRQDVIETYRGMIVDRNAMPLARDVPSDELAMDYRAMNLDDDWLKREAIRKLRQVGEWGHFASRAAQNRRIEEIKLSLAEQIITIPARIAAQLAPIEQVSEREMYERVLARFEEVRARVSALRQDIWLHRYDRDAAQAHALGNDTSSTGENLAELDDSNLDKLFRSLQLKDETASHTLWPDLPASAAIYFKQHLAEFPGLSVRDNAEYNRRDYPFGEATAHVVGTLCSVDPKALSNKRFDLPDLLKEDDAGDLAGYLPGDRMGETGVERLAENMLRGVRGVRLSSLVDPDATATASAPEERRIDPQPGQTVQLTIDASLQADMYAALRDPAKGLLRGEDGREHFVALVILSMDGQVMAVISYPSYDPNTFDDTRAALVKDKYRAPLVNRALMGTYQPGSTVKPLLASAALTEGLITPDETLTCTGHLLPSRNDIFRCDAVHGDVQLDKAIAQSCNVYFYTVGQRLGLMRLSSWYQRFGFGHDTGLELPDANGSIPPDRQEDQDAALRDARLLGIGQSYIAASPLQMANAYATLLRGGVVVPPRILAQTPVTQNRAYEISPTTLALVRQGMEHCVSEGTARDIFRGLRLRVAGKTGTAEKYRPVYDENGKPVDDPAMTPVLDPKTRLQKLNDDGTPMFRQLQKKDDDAWFIGYAPADNPRFIVAAVMEWGGFGGKRAAPMVREAMVQLQRHNYLPHTDVP